MNKPLTKFRKDPAAVVLFLVLGAPLVGALTGAIMWLALRLLVTS